MQVCILIPLPIFRFSFAGPWRGSGIIEGALVVHSLGGRTLRPAEALPGV
jgi:hypothetical protein